MQPSGPHSMYFIAILCPPPVNGKVLLCKHWMKEYAGCIVALKSPAHITLIPPFWLAEDKEMLLIQTLQSFSSNIMDEIFIQLDGFSHFGRRVLYVAVKENPALVELKNQAEIHFIHSLGESIQKDNRPFHPHITIASRDLKPVGFVKAWQHFYKKEFKETFITKSIFLLKLSSGSWKVIGEKRW
ncbi:MAG: 2'-5' RNA ligase family protein [Chitinophagaceae bacterium]